MPFPISIFSNTRSRTQMSPNLRSIIYYLRSRWNAFRSFLWNFLISVVGLKCSFRVSNTWHTIHTICKLYSEYTWVKSLLIANRYCSYILRHTWNVFRQQRIFIRKISFPIEMRCDWIRRTTTVLPTLLLLILSNVDMPTTIIKLVVKQCAQTIEVSSV